MNPTVSDCSITDYAHSDNNAGTLNPVSGLNSVTFGNFDVVPSNINTVAVYTFYILATSNGKSTYSPSI